MATDASATSIDLEQWPQLDEPAPFYEAVTVDSNIPPSAGDLHCVGAHLPLCPQHSWPKEIIINDDLPHAATSLLLHIGSHSTQVSQRLPPTPTLTPEQRGPYLPTSEYAEFERQRNSKQKNRDSIGM